MALEPSKHVNGRMWPPGVSGNPNGRPVGSRTVFSQSFLKDLASVWAERGRAAMEKTAIDQPGVFFATCARLIGPEVKLTIEQTLPGNLSMEDWADNAGDRRRCSPSHSGCCWTHRPVLCLSMC